MSNEFVMVDSWVFNTSCWIGLSRLIRKFNFFDRFALLFKHYDFCLNLFYYFADMRKKDI